ncbi:phosphate signaling complex protein PhoU [Oscillatoria sp. CS-180]|uniref:phosphate signaling complex protein PhoU n=1 Tax=Oscillatoria sp. CS-180 TaxID=3021720 RepID=UPI00232CF2E2|nr:phosphate signaling complex protein PhoU [Oscillatoria sp. CS-180]MDB9525564.1 phosphate signaling complex protein PhoU [Oscillatoria sp. CS-180]
MRNSALYPVNDPARPPFSHHLRRIQRDVLRMGALVENSCLLAKQALCDRNLEAAQSLKAHDRQVDKFYRQIEVDCIELLIHPPEGMQDLRHISAFMQLVRDLERIGDYSTDIGEAAIKLFPHPAHPCLEQIRVMIDRCRSMVALSLSAVSDLNADVGLDLKVKDDAVDEDYDLLYDRLVHSPFPDIDVEVTVLLVLVIRYLERIADHSTNIGRRIAFVITGER